MKILQKSYHGKIKMIYIDPPYNTGKDFVYPDNYHDSIENYKAITGQTDEEGNKISTNTEASGRFHTDWLNMMYPRLRLARNLLTDDGVIFISIDDNEVDNLRKICSEILGEDNFVADICVVNNLKGRNDKKYIARANERLLMYIKSSAFEEYGLALDENVVNEYKDVDENGKYRLLELRKRGGADTKKERPNMYYPFYVDIKTGKVSLYEDEIYTMKALPVKSNGEDGRWRWGKDTSEKNIDLLYGKQVGDKYNIYEKDYLENDAGARRVRPKSVLSGSAYSTDVATKEYRSIMENIEFNNPKPVTMISDLIAYATAPSNAIILDFFSGSATTAHAVMQLNAEDGGNRRFICVQLPEPTQEDSEAFKAGYKNICEIGKERIRRAGEKIKEEIESDNVQLKIGEEPKSVPDIGFKVFKLDSSNLKKWNPDFANLEVTLDDMINNYVPDRTEGDIVYEFMLKMGLDLSYPIDVADIDGRKVYSIGFGALMMCLDDNITVSVAEGMVKMYKEQAPETWKVVFRDNGFVDDCTKTNVKLTLVQAGLEEDAFTTV